jgi:hypothetical protein
LLEVVGMPPDEATPGLGLELAAEESDAELIVAAAGVAASKLLGHARYPVAIAPVGYAERTRAVHTVGVACEDRPDARSALAYARRLASRAPLRVIGVFDPAEPTYGVPENPDAARARARAQLRKAAGGDAEVKLLEGSARLAHAAGDVDLLVMAGATPELVEQAACPIVSVPAGALALAA